jgi:glyoxylase-like metal-dependent hydrolase (beta-lactamase superfamily II)
MATNPILTLDLNFLGRAHAIAVYLVRHAAGVVLIESGPGSTLSALEAGLAKEGLAPGDVTHVLLTHIHLDHAGAAGWWARQGAEIYVHPLGAPHLLNPEKLIASARRIYGHRMETLWGEFLPVPEKQLRIATDSQELVVGNLRFVPIHTPGHAEHHCSYLLEETLFCGDVGGVRMPGFGSVQVPMPPPDLHIEGWHASIARLRRLKPAQIAPTHFGIFNDPEWQFDQVDKGLESATRWLEQVMPAGPPLEQLRLSFADWVREERERIGLNEEAANAYELVNPSGMSADGLLRYWRKTRGSAVVGLP